MTEPGGESKSPNPSLLTPADSRDPSRSPLKRPSPSRNDGSKSPKPTSPRPSTPRPNTAPDVSEASTNKKGEGYKQPRGYLMKKPKPKNEEETPLIESEHELKKSKAKKRKFVLRALVLIGLLVILILAVDIFDIHLPPPSRETENGHPFKSGIKILAVPNNPTKDGVLLEFPTNTDESGIIIQETIQKKHNKTEEIEVDIKKESPKKPGIEVDIKKESPKKPGIGVDNEKESPTKPETEADIKKESTKKPGIEIAIKNESP